MKEPLRTSTGWAWFLYYPEWAEDEIDVPGYIFHHLQGGVLEDYGNGIICRVYPSRDAAIEDLKTPPPLNTGPDLLNQV